MWLLAEILINCGYQRILNNWNSGSISLPSFRVNDTKQSDGEAPVMLVV